MPFTATVENDAIKLPPGVHLPDGTQVTVNPAQGSFTERYAEFIGVDDSLPADFAVNHDHYPHGARKQQ